MRGVRILAAVMSGALVLAALPGLAARTDLLFLLPGFPGTSAQAQPYVDQMLRHLEHRLKWTPGQMTGAFIPDGGKAVVQLDKVRPGIALLDASVLCQVHDRYPMKIVAHLTATGKPRRTYHVMTREDGPSSISDLTGKRIAGPVAGDPVFVANVLLDGKIDAASITTTWQKRPLKALRDLANGKIDAAIVGDDVKDHLKTLSLPAQVRIIHSSPPIPSPAVVVMNDALKDVTPIKKAIAQLCTGTEGKERCRRMMIASISLASRQDYLPLLNACKR